MISVGVSTVLARHLSRESIYTLKLIRRGVDIGREDVSDVMRMIKAKEAMTTDFQTVPSTMKVKELMNLFQKTGSHGFPVVDDKDSLFGMVTITDVERHLGEEENGLTVAEIATRSPYVAYPEQSLERILGATDDEYGRIPVVSENDGYHIIGLLDRQDIIKAYRRTLRKMKRTVAR